ncbi:alkaline phosphatase [candidate division WOR-3 bacterium]|nr:alkaline phosphatase [candidate division WOR-3 bacterium]
MQKFKSLCLSPIIVGFFLSCAAHYATQDEDERFHNVIVLVPDGCGVAHMTIARWCKGAPLTQDSMDVSLVRTHCANSMITGSAAAATAFATGFKSWEDSEKAKLLSMRPDSLLIPEPRALPGLEQWRPSATVLEGARLAGKAVGLVATCRISHATPAAYASHWHSRDDNNIIMEQMVYQGIDVVFGGGFRYLISRDSDVPGSASRGLRRDGEDLHEVLLARGNEFITTKDELLGLDEETRRVWGMFAPNHMAHDIDRHYLAPHEPSLAEMTQKAIEVLSRDPDGFFLLVEGSQVDWSAHDNDPVGVVTDYLAFDRAVKVALDFARSPSGQRTLVVVLPDHGTGGMSLGREGVNSYTFTPDKMAGWIKRPLLTAAGVGALITEDAGDTDPSVIRQIVSEYYGIDELTAGEMEMILTELADTPYVHLDAVLGPMLSRRAGIGWTTFDHTGTDVPMFSFGFDRAPQTVDNTEIANLCAQAMGFDLRDLTERLFTDAGVLFDNCTITIDTAGVEDSMGQLVVERDGKKAQFPLFKNIMVVQDDTVSLEGLTIYSLKAHKVFLPRQAEMLFNAY